MNSYYSLLFLPLILLAPGLVAHETIQNNLEQESYLEIPTLSEDDISLCQAAGADFDDSNLMSFNKVKELLEKGASQNARNSALWSAALAANQLSHNLSSQSENDLKKKQEENLKIIEILLDYGADPITEENDVSPLFIILFSKYYTYDGPLEDIQGYDHLEEALKVISKNNPSFKVSDEIKMFLGSDSQDFDYLEQAYNKWKTKNR